VIRKSSDSLTIDADLPTGWPIQCPEELKESTLPRSTRPHQRNELTFCDVQVDSLEDFNILRRAGVSFPELPDFDEGHGHLAFMIDGGIPIKSIKDGDNSQAESLPLGYWLLIVPNLMIA
jgi:hypothetical protein